jgi:hypothetical protein
MTRVRARRAPSTTWRWRRPLLRAGMTKPTWDSREHDCLPVSVLAGLVEQIRDAATWIAILRHLGWAAQNWAYGWAYDARLAWPELPDVVSARLRENDGGPLLTKTHAELFRQFATWPLTYRRITKLLWSESTGWIDEALEEFYDWRASDSADALIRAAHSNAAAARALRRTLREDSSISDYAWSGLGRLGDTSVIMLALEELAKARRNGDGPGSYLMSLPAQTTLPIARDLITRGDKACTRMGWTLFGLHGTTADAPALYAELRRVLAEHDWDDVRSILRGLIRNKRTGPAPHPAVRACFERVPDSQDRERAAWILLLGDPIADDVAFECLWDCESDTRTLAAGRIEAATREIGHRVETMQHASTRAVTGGWPPPPQSRADPDLRSPNCGQLLPAWRQDLPDAALGWRSTTVEDGCTALRDARAKRELPSWLRDHEPALMQIA